MKETTDHVTPTGKVYKSIAIFLGTSLGGPLVAGYLLAENFKTLGQLEKVKPTWIIAAIVAVVGCVFLLLIPENISIAGRAITYAYSGAALGCFKGYQDEQVKAYIKQGGLVHSWVKAVGIGVLGGLIYLGAIFAVVLALELLLNNEIIAC